MRWSTVALVVLTLSGAAFAGPPDSIVRVVQVSPRELLFFVRGTNASFREDLAAPPKQIRIQFPSARPVEQVRELTFQQGSGFSSLFIRSKTSGSLAIIECTSPQGHVVTALPYSNAVYVRLIQWDSAAECYLGWGITAWASGQHGQALRFWRNALARGARDASVWLGIAEALQGRYAQALDYLEPFAQRTDVIPDVHAALAAAYRNRGNTEQSARQQELFVQQTGYAPLSPSPLVSIREETDHSSPSLIDIFEPLNQQLATPSPPPSPPTEQATSTPSDSDLFAELRQLQHRSNTADSANATSTSSHGSTIAILLGVGFALLLPGLYVLRSYHRWRTHRLETLAAAYAQQPETPLQPAASAPTTFDELMRIESLHTQKDGNAEPSAPNISQSQHAPPAELDEDELFDFDEETYRQHQVLKTSRPVVDEQLFYQSDGELQLSQESPSSVAPELSEQERDLLRILERISAQYDSKRPSES